MRDPLKAARRRGDLMKHRLIADTGCLLSREEAASLLRVDTAKLDRMASADESLWVDEDIHRGFPAFQFDGGVVLAGLASVMTVLPTPSFWTRRSSLFSRNAKLDGERPVDALRRGDLPSVLVAARGFLEHGG